MSVSLGQLGEPLNGLVISVIYEAHSYISFNLTWPNTSDEHSSTIDKKFKAISGRCLL